MTISIAIVLTILCLVLGKKNLSYTDSRANGILALLLFICAFACALIVMNEVF